MEATQEKALKQRDWDQARSGDPTLRAPAGKTRKLARPFRPAGEEEQEEELDAIAAANRLNAEIDRLFLGDDEEEEGDPLAVEQVVMEPVKAAALNDETIKAVLWNCGIDITVPGKLSAVLKRVRQYFGEVVCRKVSSNYQPKGFTLPAVEAGFSVLESGVGYDERIQAIRGFLEKRGWR